MSQHSEKIQQTIDYYDEHADEYIRSTFDIDMSALYQPFLSRLKKGQRILDAGCGSGRDTKAFLNLGYDVVPIDASPEMTIATRRLARVVAQQIRLQEITFENEFDGIWACASLLHVPFDELRDVIDRLVRATRCRGVLYFSFKEGKGERLENGRLFTDFMEKELIDFLSCQSEITLEQVWVTVDARPERTDRWVNVIAVKAEST